MKRIFATAVAVAFTLVAAGNAAAGITVSAKGVFSNGQPSSNPQYYCAFGVSTTNCTSTDVNASDVRWGSGSAKLSGLEWLGAVGTSTDYGTPFLIGQLTHFNFPIYNGLSSVTLTPHLQVSNGGTTLFTHDVPVTVNIDETPNTDYVQQCKYYPQHISTVPCDDRITWTLPPAQSVIPASGGAGPWVLNIVGFGSSSTDPTSTTTEFFSQENGSNTAYLWASLGTVGTAAAQNDAYSTVEDVPLHADATTNDAAGATYSLASQASHGVAGISPSGQVTYTPSANYTGADSFVYLANYSGTLALARVTIDVQPDTTAPTLTIVSPVVFAEATGPAGASSVSYALPTASDTDDTAGPVTCTPASPAAFPLGSSTVTCSSTDSHANTGTGTITVIVHDTTPPAFTGCTPSISRESDAPGGATVTGFEPTATDLVSGAVAVTSDHPSSFYALGPVTVTFTATDAAGNAAQCTTSVTVVDTVAPAWSAVPADITAEATGPAGAAVSFTAPSASDLNLASSSCSNASGDVFPLGISTVTCSATDSSGNASHVSFKVTVVDTTAPTVHVPSSLTVNASGTTGAPVTFSATATDLVDGAVPVTCTPPSGSTFATGTTTVTCTATDAHGNTGSASFTVTVHSAGAMLNDLWLAVNGLPPGNSLPAKVKSAKAYYAAGDIADTCSMLASFISEVQAQSGKKLTTAQANDLIARARAIRAILGC